MSIILNSGEQRQLDTRLTPIPVEPARLFGYVMDANTDSPIASATIQLLVDAEVQYFTQTDTNGYFDIMGIIPGTYNGLVTAPGYINYPF